MVLAVVAGGVPPGRERCCAVLGRSAALLCDVDGEEIHVAAVV